jgi:hypothetical protein
MRILLAAILGLSLAAPSGWAGEREDAGREYSVKAAFIRQFTRYVTWPEGTFKNPADPIVLGVLGENPFGNALDQIASGGGSDARGISVKYYRTIEEYEPCQILFVSASEVKGMEKILDKTRNLPVLIIGDTPGLAEAGAVINFVIEDNKVRFEVNPEAARQAHLQISSKLLHLAKLVGPPK